MSQIICLHHNDADGRASGAVVRYALGKDVLLYEMDYGASPIPWNAIETASQVIIVDFSLTVEEMKRIHACTDIVWIDHHISAMKQMQGIADSWKGIRNNEEAACVLTWRYFFPDKPVPQALILIGDRDIWRWAEKDTGAFNEGLFHLNTHADNDELWRPLLENNQELLSQIIHDGARLREARLGQIKRMVSHYGFEVLFEGFRTMAINAPGNGDIGQHIRDLGYEVAYCYVDQMNHNKLITSVTLFSAVTDVSKIALKYGGGGHAGAAGFSFPRGNTPFPPKASVEWNLAKSKNETRRKE